MNNRKGFTLIELLGVIAITGLVVALSTFGISKVIDNSKTKAEEVAITGIEKAANSFSNEEADTNWKMGENNENVYFCTTIGELINKGFIKEKDALASKYKKEYDRNSFVIVSKNNVTKTIEKTSLIFSGEASDEYKICSGSITYNGETIDSYPSLSEGTTYTDEIENILFTDAVASSSIQSGTRQCFYGTSVNNMDNIDNTLVDEINKTCNISGLKSSTNYYVKVCMKTNNGSFACSNAREYNTLSIKEPTISVNSTSNKVTITYKTDNIKGTHYNYFKSPIDGISNKDSYTCTNNNNVMSCKETATTTIVKNTWYQVNADTVSIDYNIDGLGTVEARTYDKTGNYNSSSQDISIYKITFKKGNADKIDDGTVDIEKLCLAKSGATCKIKSPTIDRGNNYAVIGWNTDSSATTSIWDVGLEKAVNKNDTYYPITKRITYTVNHYIRNMGANTYTLNSTEQKNGSSGSTVTLANLKKSISGFTYDGGYTKGSTIRPTSGAVTSTTVLEDSSRVINLYYRRNYLYVKYHVNGGSLASDHGEGFGITSNLVTHNGNDSFLRGVYEGKVGAINETTLAATSGLHNYNSTSYINLFRTGYHVNSGTEWNTKSDGSGTSYNQTVGTYDANGFAGADLTTGDKTVTIYVNWKIDTYSIKYDANGGSGAPSTQTKTYGVDLTLSSTKPTYTGYAFQGWSESKTATSATYQAGGKYTKNEGTTLYAVWSDSSEPTSSITTTSTLKAKQQTATLECTDNVGVVSYYWGTSSSPAASSYTSITSTKNMSITKNVTEAKTYYLICKDNNGNTSSANKTYVNYTVVNRILKSSGTKGTYTTDNYEVGKDANGKTLSDTYLAPASTTMVLKNAYTISLYSSSARFAGASIGEASTTAATPSTSSLTISSGKTYTMWFNRNYITFKYKTNGGTIKEETTYNGSTYKWKINDSDNLIMYSKDGADYKAFTNDKRQGQTNLDLNNYNGTVMNITKTGYKGVSGAEWICESGCLTSGTTISQAAITDFNTDAVCDLKTANCTVILKVNWTPKTYTVSYSCGDGTGTISSQTATYDNSFAIAKGGCTRTGYTFAGWTTKSDGTDDGYGWTGWIGTWQYDNGQYGIASNKLALKARWTANTNTKYTVKHYVRNIGDNTYTLNSTDNNTGTTGNSVTLTNLKKSISGFTYDGGYISGDTTRPTSGAVTTTTIKADGSRVINLYYRRNYLYVQYNMNGGSLASEHGDKYSTSGNLITYNDETKFKRGVYGGKVGGINSTTLAASSGLHNYNSTGDINIIKTGYIAKGNAEWNTKADGSGTSYDQVVTSYDANGFAGVNLTTGDKTVTIYVNWTPKTYTVSYNCNGGTGSISSQTATYNKSFTIAKSGCTRTGYTFAGWTTKSDGTDDGYGWTGWSDTWKYDNGQFGIASNKLALKARWTINKVTIKYNMNNGTWAGSKNTHLSANSSGYILYDSNVYTETVNYGASQSSDGPANYNNSNYINISRSGYIAVKGAEWKTSDGSKTFNQATAYSASDFCNVSSGSCTVVLYVNWTKAPPTITFSPNGGSSVSDAASVNGGTTIKITCKSDSEITSFSASDDTDDDGSVVKNDTYEKEIQITMQMAGHDRWIQAVCTAKNGTTTGQVKKYYNIKECSPTNIYYVKASDGLNCRTGPYTTDGSITTVFYNCKQISACQAYANSSWYYTSAGCYVYGSYISSTACSSNPPPANNPGGGDTDPNPGTVGLCGFCKNNKDCARGTCTGSCTGNNATGGPYKCCVVNNNMCN